MGQERPQTSNNYLGVAISADGKTLLAGQGTSGSIGALEVSTDGETTWKMPGGVNSDRYHVAMSSDGSKMIAVGGTNSTVSTPSGIYTSVDSGATWVHQVAEPTASWHSTAMSSDGTSFVFASVSSTKIWTGTWN